jgi:hypothetical protein
VVGLVSSQQPTTTVPSKKIQIKKSTITSPPVNTKKTIWEKLSMVQSEKKPLVYTSSIVLG